MHLLQQPVPAVVHRAGIGPASPAPLETGARLDIIRRRGVLTVGYLPDSLPYAFFNAADDLVGLDVELAHRLAAELGVRLEFVPLDRERAVDQINAGECDLVDVRRRRHDAAREPDALLDVLPRRDDGVRRAGQTAQRVGVLGPSCGSGPASGSRFPTFRTTFKRFAAACHRRNCRSSTN